MLKLGASVKHARGVLRDACPRVDSEHFFDEFVLAEINVLRRVYAAFGQPIE